MLTVPRSRRWTSATSTRDCCVPYNRESQTLPRGTRHCNTRRFSRHPCDLSAAYSPNHPVRHERHSNSNAARVHRQGSQRRHHILFLICLYDSSISAQHASAGIPNNWGNRAIILFAGRAGTAHTTRVSHVALTRCAYTSAHASGEHVAWPVTERARSDLVQLRDSRRRHATVFDRHAFRTQPTRLFFVVP